MRASRNLSSRSAARLVLSTLLLLVAAVSASAETLMMPKRDARKNVPVVVWGITTQPNTATCSLDFGDGTPVQNCTGADRSYKAYAHTYASQGVFTATMTVGVEVASVQVTVFDPALLPGGATGDNNRSLGINMAIQDGLRYMWYSHNNRGSFDTQPQGVWSSSGYGPSETAMVVLAFQNHGYKLPSDPTVQPTGLYEKYVVRRGINYVIANLSTITIGNQTYGDPRAAGFGVAAGDSTALKAPYPEGYTSAIAMLPFAGSGALNRVNTEVPGYTNGKTYGEILQRITNGLSWGQLETGTGRGSWYYSYNQGYHDGSTVGWDVLAYLAAEAAGVTVPAFVKSEFQRTLDCHVKPDGSWNYGHYQTCTNTTSDYITVEKGGIPLQGMAWTGDSTKAPLVINWLNTYWNNGPHWQCSANYGCGYAMFNTFKGLKLQGVNTLSNVNRSTRAWKFLGTSGVEDDWYADYQDYLVYTQSNPNTTTGGQWGGMGLYYNSQQGNFGNAIAELILSPVALVLPDERKFNTVGLSPSTNTALELTTHTVTAHAESTGGSAVPGATVNFTVLSGPNAGLTGTGTTDANGNATFTYTDQGPVGSVGVDTIQASIGNMPSNIVEMTWTPLNAAPVAADDADSTFSGTPVTVAVLGNDTDADGDTLTVTGTSGGPASGSVVVNANGTITYTPNLGFAGTDSFTYAVADGKGGTASATVTITVTKRAATVTAGSNTKVYGSADPELTATSNGFLAGDGIVVSQTPRDGGENVGLYATHATATGDLLANYDVTYTDGVLEITPAPTTTVVTCPASVVYNSAAQTVCTATVTGAGGLNEAVTLVTYTNNVNVGTAGASATYAGDTNYTASTGSASFEITKAPSTTVVTCPASVMYTSAPQTGCTATVTGVGGLDEAVTPVTYTNNVNVGTAGASATYEGDANHAASTGSATFAITPAPLTVSANSYTRSYLAADPVLSGTLAGVLGADGITATYSSTGTGSQTPGVYPTVPTLVDPNGKLGNYAVSSTNGTLTITNTVPVCTIAPSIASIWPPNHKMVSITASGATDVDGGSLTYKVVSIFQDEPTNTTGDGNTAIDGAGIGTSTAQVRAERTGDPKNPGDGRVYHITFSVTDSLGLSCEATVKVGVPHDQSGKVQPVDGGPIYNSTVAGPPPAATAKGKGN